MAETMGGIDEAQRKLYELDQRRRREQETIRELCARCTDLDDQERYVILKRYLYREKWDDIGFWMDLGDRRLFQIHRSACDKLDAFLGP